MALRCKHVDGPLEVLELSGQISGRISRNNVLTGISTMYIEHPSVHLHQRASLRLPFINNGDLHMVRPSELECDFCVCAVQVTAQSEALTKTYYLPTKVWRNLVAIVGESFPSASVSRLPYDPRPSYQFVR